jgi:hypothetical protein
MLRNASVFRALSRFLFLVAPAAAGIALSGCGGSVVGSPVTGSSTPPVQSQNTVNAGPTLGYIWSDTAQTLRPILGVPGSTQLGQSVVPAGLYTHAATSALSRLALLEETDGSLDLMTLPGGQPVRLSVTIPGAQLRFAPGGLAAIAFVPGSKTAMLLTGLSSTPANASISFPAPVAEAAVSDNGVIASALTQGSGFQIQTASATSTSTTVGAASGVGGLSFVPASSDLLFADSLANTLTLVHNNTATTLPSAGLLNAPAGIGASRDGHWAVLANTGDTNIVRVDLTSQSAPQSFPCACQPAFVTQLSGTGAFRVTAAESGPAWMFDASSVTPRVLFIPVRSAANAAAFVLTATTPQKAN